MSGVDLLAYIGFLLWFFVFFIIIFVKMWKEDGVGYWCFLKSVILHISVDAHVFESAFLPFLSFFGKNLRYSGQIENAKNGFFHFFLFFCHFYIYVFKGENGHFGLPLFTPRSSWPRDKQGKTCFWCFLKIVAAFLRDPSFLQFFHEICVG